MGADFIVRDGKKYFSKKQLEIPRHDDFFVATGEIEFGGMYQETGHFNERAYESACKEHSENIGKFCENKLGYYCKKPKCQYPNCLTEKKPK